MRSGAVMNQIFSFMLSNLPLSFMVSICLRQSYHHCPIITSSPLSPHSGLVSRLLVQPLLPQPSDIFVHHLDLGLWLVHCAAFICKHAYIWWHMKAVPFSVTFLTFWLRQVAEFQFLDERTLILYFKGEGERCPTSLSVTWFWAFLTVKDS